MGAVRKSSSVRKTYLLCDTNLGFVGIPPKTVIINMAELPKGTLKLILLNKGDSKW